MVQESRNCPDESFIKLFLKTSPMFFSVTVFNVKMTVIFIFFLGVNASPKGVVCAMVEPSSNAWFID